MNLESPYLEQLTTEIAENQMAFDSYPPGCVPEQLLKIGLLLGARRDAYQQGVADERGRYADLVDAMADILSLRILDGFRQRCYQAALDGAKGLAINLVAVEEAGTVVVRLHPRCCPEEADGG